MPRRQMGYFTAVLDPDPTSPAGLVSHHHVQTGYEDAAGLAELARLCRHHHRIRERAGAALRTLAAHPARGAWPATRVAVARTARPKRPISRAAACPARPMP
jgi:5-(carboxyamino)imidazole ribonucleotide synthase